MDLDADEPDAEDVGRSVKMSLVTLASEVSVANDRVDPDVVELEDPAETDDVSVVGLG